MLIFEGTFTLLFKDKKFCIMIKGSGSRGGSGSIPLTRGSESGFGRPKKCGSRTLPPGAIYLSYVQCSEFKSRLNHCFLTVADTFLCYVWFYFDKKWLSSLSSTNDNFEIFENFLQGHKFKQIFWSCIFKCQECRV